ncbi:MAG: elongation factor G [Clostridium sp.]
MSSQEINLRNIGIMGHGASGKTTLTESILFNTKAIDRRGRVEDGNTLSDYDVEERRRRISITATVAFCKYKKNKINLVDIPGYFDFVGEMIQGLQAVDLALIVVCGVSGVEVGTEKSWKYVENKNMPRTFFINKLDRENSDFDKTLSELKKNFGNSVIPIHYPIGSENSFRGIINIITGKALMFNEDDKSCSYVDIPDNLKGKIKQYRTMITEVVAETDESLLESYLEKGYLEDESIYKGISSAAAKGEITPVMCGSSFKQFTIGVLLDDILECFPSPIESSLYEDVFQNKDEIKEVRIGSNEAFSALVFKTIADPFIGKMSIFRVITGEAKADSIVYNSNKDRDERLGTLYYLKGKDQIPTKSIGVGDIGAVSKLQFTSTGDTLCNKDRVVKFKTDSYPEPVYAKSVIPKSNGDEDKISNGLNKLLDEDKTFRIVRDIENSECIVYGMGLIHLEVLGNKLKNKFGVDIELRTPRVQYRETIKRIADVQGKHKKQSGGHGQYGDVKIKFEQRNDGINELQFIDKVVGGSVPKQYIPAVEKGLKECVVHGILAGYPIIRLKATLYDGSYHAVDSSEMAFKIAASLAFKKGIKEACPILLEPIMCVEITSPDSSTGDIISDINRKRGRIMGMQSHKNGQKITAEVPQGEMFEYAMDLRAMTSGRGEFTMKFSRYEELSSELCKKIIDEYSL